MAINILAQTKNWVTQKTEDGSVTVRSCIVEHKNDRGEILPLIEYTATATMAVDMRKLHFRNKKYSKPQSFF